MEGVEGSQIQISELDQGKKILLLAPQTETESHYKVLADWSEIFFFWLPTLKDPSVSAF